MGRRMWCWSTCIVWLLSWADAAHAAETPQPAAPAAPAAASRPKAGAANHEAAKNAAPQKEETRAAKTKKTKEAGGEEAKKPKQEPFDLGEIVITPALRKMMLKDSPGSVSVIDGKDIEAQANVLGDAGRPLDRQTGVRVQRFGAMGAATSVRIRGTLSTHALVLVDGMPVNAPSLGSADLSWLSADMIERIEIVRGPMSPLYGGNAVGGVVNIITKRPPKKWTAKASTSYGTDATSINYFMFGGSAGRFGFIVQGNYRKNNGMRGGHFHNDEFWQKEIRTSVTFDVTEDILLTVDLGAHESWYEMPGPRPVNRQWAQQVGRPNWEIPNPRIADDWTSSGYDHQHSRRYSGSASLEGDNWKIQAWRREWTDQVWQQSVVAYWPPPTWTRTEGDQYMSNRFRTYMYGLKGRYTLPEVWRNTVTVGGSYQRENFRVFSKQYNAPNATFTDLVPWQVNSDWDDTRRTWSFFVQDEIDLDPLTITIGARRDMPNDYESKWTYRATGVLDVTDTTRLRAGYGQAYRPPSLNDVNWPRTAFAEGNPDLEPEWSWSWEAGVEQEIGKFAVTRLTYWQQKVSKMITWSPSGSLGPFGRRWTPDNVDLVRIHGIEWENRINLYKNLTARVGLTYFLKRKQKTHEVVNSATNAMAERNRQLSNTPVYTLDMGLDWADVLGVKGLHFNADGVFVGRRELYYAEYKPWPSTAVDYHRKTLSPYFLLNLKVSQTIKTGKVKWLVFAAVDNVTDNTYSTQFGMNYFDRDYPAPGRTFLLGVSGEY